MATTSKYRGVTVTDDYRFIASISNTYLGIYDSEEVAALVYDMAASAMFGDFARLNFPELEPLDSLRPIA